METTEKRSTGKFDRKGREIFEGNKVLTWNVPAGEPAPQKAIIKWRGSATNGFFATYFLVGDSERETGSHTGLGNHSSGKYGVEVIG